MKGKRLKLCGRLVFALLLLQIIGFTGGRLQVSARADDENVITKEYHGFTCKIINEEELIVSGEGILGYECNELLEESNSNGMKYRYVTFKSITFEEGIEGITSSCSLNNAEYINLPASCTEIDTYFWKYALNHTVNLSPENTQYTLEDGVVYSKDKSELLMATPKEYEKFTIPATVEKIQSVAFSGCKIKDLYFADNGKLTELGSNAFPTYSSCAVETVHIPNYIEVIGSNNFNYDTNIIIEEGSQLKSICSVSGYGDISFLENQITDVSFLKNAKKLKNLYINYANLSNESIEVLNELEELEEIHVVNGSGNLSQEFLDRNRSKFEMTISMGERFYKSNNYNFVLSGEPGANQLPIIGGYLNFNDDVETSEYFNENKVVVKSGVLDTTAGITIAEKDASVPVKIRFVDWDANMALEEHSTMNANFIIPYLTSEYTKKQMILDSNANLWEVTEDDGEFKISKKGKDIEEYIASGVYICNTKDTYWYRGRYDNTEVTLSKSGELRYGDVKVSDNVIRYDKLYALTQSGELKDMNGKVILNHIVDFAGCYGWKNTSYVAGGESTLIDVYIILDSNGDLYELEYGKEDEIKKIDENVSKIQQGRGKNIFCDSWRNYESDAWSYYLKNDGELYSCLVNNVKDEEEGTYKFQMEYVNISSDISDILDFNIFKKTDGSIWYIGCNKYKDGYHYEYKFCNQKIISAEFNIQSTIGQKLKYLDCIGTGNLSDYFFKDNNGKKYMVDQENRILLCDSELAKAGDELIMDVTPTDVTPTDSESTMPILKTNIRRYENYNNYGDYIELKEGNLYSNGVIIMTNVVDFVKFHTESHNDCLLIIRTDGTLWTLNYYEHGEKAVPIKVYSFYEEEKTKMGDANGDGEINVKDSAMLKRYLAGWDVKWISKRQILMGTVILRLRTVHY